jgi:hypothetical protein
VGCSRQELADRAPGIAVAKARPVYLICHANVTAREALQPGTGGSPIKSRSMAPIDAPVRRTGRPTRLVVMRGDGDGGSERPVEWAIEVEWATSAGSTSRLTNRRRIPQADQYRPAGLSHSSPHAILLVANGLRGHRSADLRRSEIARSSVLSRAQGSVDTADVLGRSTHSLGRRHSGAPVRRTTKSCRKGRG